LSAIANVVVTKLCRAASADNMNNVAEREVEVDVPRGETRLTAFVHVNEECGLTASFSLRGALALSLVPVIFVDRRGTAPDRDGACAPLEFPLIGDRVRAAVSDGGECSLIE